MMNCKSVQNVFSLILEDEASSRDRSEFQGHLAGCSSCREDYAAFEATSELVKTLSPIEPSPGFEDRVLSRIRAAGSTPVTIEYIAEKENDMFSPSAWFPRIGLAAAAAAFIVFAFLAVGKMDRSGAPQMAEGSRSVETLKERIPDLPDEVLNALNEDSYVLDRMVVRAGSNPGEVRVVAPVGYESGPVFVAF